MSKETWVGKKGLRYWYYKYRDSEYFSLGFTALTVVGCVILLFYIIIPQVTSWFSIRDEIVATRERINILQDNINFMNNLDKGQMNSQMQTAAGALPPEKDFGAMLDVLSNAAVTSGVSLNDFSFQVGNVASSSGLVLDSRHKNIASVKITVVALGTVSEVKKFINVVQNSVPISEVVNIDGSGQTISVSIQFYQKNLKDIKIQEDQPLKQLSAEKFALLQQLNTWKKSQPGVNLDGPEASGPALPLF